METYILLTASAIIFALIIITLAAIWQLRREAKRFTKRRDYGEANRAREPKIQETTNTTFKH